MKRITVKQKDETRKALGKLKELLKSGSLTFDEYIERKRHLKKVFSGDF